MPLILLGSLIKLEGVFYFYFDLGLVYFSVILKLLRFCIVEIVFLFSFLKILLYDYKLKICNISYKSYYLSLDCLYIIKITQSITFHLRLLFLFIISRSKISNGFSTG